MTYPLCITPNPDGFNRQYDLFVQQTTTPGCTGAVQPLQTGQYLLTISAQDGNGVPSQANPPDQRTFTIVGLKITMDSPKTGVGTGQPIQVTLRTHELLNNRDTNRSASCRWTNNQTAISITQQQYDRLRPFTSTGTHLHTLAFDGRGVLQVLCRETTGRLTYGRYDLDFDTTPPRISNVSITPQLVTDPGRKYTTISLITDDNSVCTYQELPNGAPEKFPRNGTQPFEEEGVASTYGKQHEAFISYDITDTIEHKFRYAVVCKNLAGQQASVQANVTVKLTDTITILSPGAYVNSSKFTLNIKTHFNPTRCTVNNVRMTQDSDPTLFSTEFTNVSDGKYTIPINCTLPGKELIVRHDIMVDTIPPAAPNVSVEAPICNGPILVRMQATDVNPKDLTGTERKVATGVVYYEYTVGNVRNTTTRNLISISAADGEKISVAAVDAAENVGEATEVTISSSSLCDTAAECNTDDECGSATCNEGTCTAACTSDLQCEIGHVCNQGTCAPDPLCTDGVKSGLETDVDCGGNCKACELDVENTDGGFDWGETPEGTEGALEEPESNLLPILLMAFGIAMMGGAGYFLYDQNKQKSYSVPQSYTPREMPREYTPPEMPREEPKSDYTPALAPMQPKLEEKYEQNKEQRQRALDDKYKKMIAEKKEKRKELFKAFDAEEKKEEPEKEFIDVKTLQKDQESVFDKVARLKK